MTEKLDRPPTAESLRSCLRNPLVTRLKEEAHLLPMCRNRVVALLSTMSDRPLTAAAAASLNFVRESKAKASAALVAT